MGDWPGIVRDLTPNPWARAVAVIVTSVLVAWLANLIIVRFLSRLAARTATDLDEKILARLRRPIFVTVVLCGVRVSLEPFEMGAGLVGWISTLLLTIVIVLWTSAVLSICSEVIHAMGRQGDRVGWIDGRTVPLIDNVGKVIVVGVAGYMLLQAWNLDVAPWLASAGIAGIALGFAAKDTLANLFGGLFVIIDSPYKIGDFINLDSGERGQVVKIGLRSTRLLTRDDVEITVPNAVIANAKIVNETGGPAQHTRVVVHAGVAYGSDVDQVRRILLEAATSVEQVIDDPPARIRFHEMGDSALIFRVLCWVEEPVQRGQCIDGLNTAIYKRLTAEGISIPFPQRDVHLYRRPAP